MDDTKPANETNEPGLNKIDLSQLQDFTFGTQWTEVKNTPGGARRDDRRERRDDGGRGAPPRDRRAFRKPAVAPTGAGGPGPGGGGSEPAMRERPQGEGFRGGPRREFRGGGDRGERRDFRGGDRRDGPPMERGPYISPYFTMTCYPEDAGFAAMVKAVRASCRTFQLFEITKAVLEKNERFVLVIQRKSERNAPTEGREGEAAAAPARAEKPAPLFMSVPDHLPFETEEAALHHVMTNHLGTFFSTAEVEIDPPKGNFPIINKCGVTGELLGPPNYHKYQQILQQHHASRLGRMSFERFRDSIQSVREPEVVQQWLDKMKKATRYTWVYGQKPAAPKVAAVEAGPETAPTETPAAPQEGEAAASTGTPSAGAPAQADATPPESPAAEASATPAAASPIPEPLAAAAASTPSFDSLEEARGYLLATAREKALRAVENVRFHGRLIEKLPPGEIRRAVEGHVERQRRFPLDTANALRGRLRREGFTIFKKGSRGVSYVCAVKRRFRVPGQVFSETITALIDFIEKNPLIHVKDLPRQLLGIEVGAPPAAAPAEGQAPTPAPALPPEQADKIRKMSNDLRWLVTEGYVTEFSDGTLFAPPPMSPAQKRPDEHGEEHDPVDFPEAPAAAKPAEPAPADPAPTEAGESPAEAGEAQAPSGSAGAPAESGEPAPVSEGAPAAEEAPPDPETKA